ncbi:MAG: hypothetical protein JNK25_01395 [Phycisphaerae bacterium]|nr:hypothetical protein [Phycisphaerae bacterium]
MKLRASRFSFVPCLFLACISHAQIFTDDFNAGPSPQWSNERGNWTAIDGRYDSLAPSNNPTTRSLLPYILGDLSFEVDVIGLVDGGIWVRTDPDSDSGVLLVTGGFLGMGRGLYWHIVQHGTYSAALGRIDGLFTANQNVRIRVVVRGDLYTAYVNGSCTPATSITTDLFSSGRVGLYDFSAQQSFDNVVLDLPPPIIADFNQDGGVDGADVQAFFAAWENGDSASDVNQDGGVDGADVETFFFAWENGCA